MQRVKCEKNHYYDGDKYASCPVCAREAPSPGTSAPAPTAAPEPEPRSGGWFRRGLKKQKTGEITPPTGKEARTGSDPSPRRKTGEPGTVKTVPLNLPAMGDWEDDAPEQAMSPQGADMQARAEVGGFQPQVDPRSFQPQAEMGGFQPQVDPRSFQPQQDPGGFQPQAEPRSLQPQVDPRSFQPQAEPISSQPRPEAGSQTARQGGGNSLQSELGRVNKGNEPKTMSYWGNNFSDEPPVGWFACIGGPCVGSVYEIYSGKNGIGRKFVDDNRIIIQQDGKISGTRHTTVMYDPKGRKFYLLPGEGSGMVYRNDEIILNIMELQARDVLQIGDTKLMLAPLCGPDFTWEDWVGQDDGQEGESK